MVQKKYSVNVKGKIKWINQHAESVKEWTQVVRV
jgi:hypothetical protein